eukprot:jgi/Chlat1/5910/Chrsp4S06403
MGDIVQRYEAAKKRLLAAHALESGFPSERQAKQVTPEPTRRNLAGAFNSTAKADSSAANSSTPYTYLNHKPSSSTRGSHHNFREEMTPSAVQTNLHPPLYANNIHSNAYSTPPPHPSVARTPVSAPAHFHDSSQLVGAMHNGNANSNGVKPARREFEGVMVVALRSENEHLRIQTNSLSAQIGQLRAELSAAASRRAELEATAERARDYEALASEVDRFRAVAEQSHDEKARLRDDVRRLEDALADATHSNVDTQVAYEARLHSLEDTISSATSSAKHLADEVERFQRHVFPAFQRPSDSPPSASNTNECPLHNELSRLEKGLGLLRVIVDAKAETLNLVRDRLKEENNGLRKELRLAQQLQREAEEVISDARRMQSTEREALRGELLALQRLHQQETSLLHKKLREMESTRQDTLKQAKRSDAHSDALAAQIAALEREVSCARREADAQKSEREKVEEELTFTRRSLKNSQGELEALKLSQKYLIRGGGDSKARVPEDKMELMRLCDRLMQERGKVQEEKASLEEELRRLQRSQVQSRIQRSPPKFSEVSMIAHDQVTEAELTNKLVAQKLEFSQ